MNDSRRPDPRREACDELAELLAQAPGRRTAQLLKLAGLLTAPEPAAPAARAGWPRAISLWQPREVAGEQVFVRPEPGPWGDHCAIRRTLSTRKPPGVLRICFFGESAAAGYLYAPHVTPAQVLEHRLGAGGESFEVVDLARTNEGLGSLVATFEAALQLVPDLFVIFTGNNWNLLEIPEISSYFPSPVARRRVGQALRQGGVRAVLELARRRLRSKTRAALAQIARLAVRAGVPVVLVVPEVNLADWENRQPPVWLPGDGNARWHKLFAAARPALEAKDWTRVLDLAGQMRALDDGLCPTSHRLRARALEGLGRLGEACEAARDEVAAGAYPTLCSLGSPQATGEVQEILRGAAAEHRWSVVDLPAVFAAETSGASPGNRFFLDYCHLTFEGMEIAMAAVAAQIRNILGLARLPEGPGFAVAAEIEATARLGAAIHGAHRLLAVGSKPALLEPWCRGAFAASPGVAAAMLDLCAARVAPCPAVVSAAQARNFVSPYRLSLQHGWRWAWLDAELLAALDAALGTELPSADSLAVSPEGVDLTRPPFLWEPLERFYPEALELDGRNGHLAFRAPWPTSSFCLVVAEPAEIVLELTLRLPPVPGVASDRRETVSVHVGEAEVGTVEASTSWRRHTLRLPAACLQQGLNRLTLYWPPPSDDGETALAAAARRLEDGLDADLHPVFGELASLRARLGATPSPR